MGKWKRDKGFFKGGYVSLPKKLQKEFDKFEEYTENPILLEADIIHCIISNDYIYPEKPENRKWMYIHVYNKKTKEKRIIKNKIKNLYLNKADIPICCNYCILNSFVIFYKDPQLILEEKTIISLLSKKRSFNRGR